MNLIRSYAIASLAIAAALSAAPPDGYFNRNGTICLFSSSHQDIAWMDSPQACMLFRVNQCIMPATRIMAKNPHYAFVMENMLNLNEYLEQRPQDRDLIRQLTLSGRLEWGATYNQPYEDLLSGEELIRETYFGRRWLKRIFPGADARVAFNPDVPGRSLQMPQILAKAGVPYMVVSRYHEGIYRWFSPDGSSVLTYTPGHYGEPLKTLNLPAEEAVPALVKHIAGRSAFYEEHKLPPVLPMLYSQDFSQPKDFEPLMAAWNATDGPRLQYTSAVGFFEKIDQPGAQFPARTGMRPDIWLYIGGPTHHWAISAKRDAAHLLPAAETFSTVRSLLDGNFRAYPADRLSHAWKEAIYPDHGWGGKNGHITDILFKEKAEFATAEAKAVLADTLQNIASRVAAKPAKGTPVVLFNSLAWKRNDAVQLDATRLPAGRERIVDESGATVPCQKTSLESPRQINVASAANGARATADSSESASLIADRAIDGKVSHLESERWVSAADNGPHWLVVDFGKPRTVHTVILHHEGSLGRFQDIDDFNTADFQVQSADSADGPWKDLVAPVRGNKAVFTTHRFAPHTFRMLRVYITRAGAKDGEPARLFEVEALSDVAPKADKLVCAVAGIPPVGYKTYYATAGTPAHTAPTADKPVLEDKHYRVTLAPGGIRSIFDKELGKELLDTGKFLGGEIFTLQSVGYGAGEFTAVQQPTMEGFDKASNHNPRWQQVEDGPVRTVVEFTSDWTGVTVRERILFYHQEKRIDFDIALLNWDGTRYREFRAAWPIRAPQGQVAYEVPMGVVEVGKSEVKTTGGFAYGNVDYAGYIPDIHPREVRDFINVSGDEFGATLSSSVAVFDYIDPTTNPVSYPVIQPILLASRKSCHDEGNWYLQPGDHHFLFSFTSGAPGWRNTYRAAHQANQPLLPVIQTQPVTGSLPSEQSFFSFSGGNLLLSMLKKSEDDDSAILRFYDLEGSDMHATIRSFVPVKQAERTDLIEERPQPLQSNGNSIELNVGHHAIETVKFTPATR